MVARSVTGYERYRPQSATLRLYEGVPEYILESDPRVLFGENNEEVLHIAPLYDDVRSLEKIGAVSLCSDIDLDVWHVQYGFEDDKLSRWGGKGLMLQATDFLLATVAQKYPFVRAAHFDIICDNWPSRKLAEGLGAAIVSRGFQVAYQLDMDMYRCQEVAS